LLCGCLAIVEVIQNKSIITASILIIIALICDFFDGFIARLLKVSSPIGKELDSLADVVSFGVLPAFILSYVIENHAGVTSELKYFPLLIALFSALRLAKFNIDTRQSDSFIGLNTPANTILISSVAINLENLSTDLFSNFFHNQFFIFGFVLLSSYLLVAEIPMFAFKFKHFKWKGNEVRFGFILLAIILISIFKIVAIPWLIVVYILTSVILNFQQKTLNT
jgi:CDP-diacylglycerol---serine O-phosphatidyltransferase